MRICFFASEKPRERLLADAFARGVIEHGDEIVIRPLTEEPQVANDCEVACMVGVKSKELFMSNWQAGVHTIMFDKGYCRHRLDGPVKLWEFWRVAVDGHHPTSKLMRVARPSDRWDRLELEMKPWRAAGEKIVIAGSSAKYHEFYSLDDPTSYARRVIKKLRKYSPERPIVYRPKPSWREAEPIEGTYFSRSPESIDQVLENAHVVITHGSNACFEAMLAGVPTIVLGDAVAKPVSSTRLNDIENPLLATDEERRQWAYNLAYCQYTMHEMSSGEAWNILRPQIYG
ncbi:hypothetical protein MPL3356_60505 [Mesorhizobium plurifarium]|uniref:Uncharacterized protein n=1 Tax=Mesorhizobium plurifarium TaxID=69974 RepID=A0A090E9T8_MESPL|nr:hypothetical protein MPL3356_60505 [Mesorhizobium plurifarium]